LFVLFLLGDFVPIRIRAGWLTQCDQRFGKKIAEIWQKVAQKIAEQKNAKISTSKPISKSEIPTTKQVLKLLI
jgi:hypothetical protein